MNRYKGEHKRDEREERHRDDRDERRRESRDDRRKDGRDERRRDDRHNKDGRIRDDKDHRQKRKPRSSSREPKEKKPRRGDDPVKSACIEQRIEVNCIKFFLEVDFIINWFITFLECCNVRDCILSNFPYLYVFF